MAGSLRLFVVLLIARVAVVAVVAVVAFIAVAATSSCGRDAGAGVPGATRETDPDGDGMPSMRDNCPQQHNPEQTDSDGDGVGDACDSCPMVMDPSQADLDSNGLGDACELPIAPATCERSQTECPACLHVFLSSATSAKEAQTGVCLCRSGLFELPDILSLESDAHSADLLLADTRRAAAVRCRYVASADAGAPGTSAPQDYLVQWCSGVATPGMLVLADYVDLTQWSSEGTRLDAAAELHLDEQGCECACSSGSVCDAAGLCVPWAQCTDLCADHLCGEVCGQNCGACASDAICLAGACVAARPSSCDDCPLRLVVADASAGDALEVNLEFQPGPSDLLPRLADIWVQGIAAVLESVTPGPALTEAGKSLEVDPSTGRPWRLHEGRYRIVALSSDTATIGAGVVLSLRFRRAGRASAVRLARHEQVFAPPGADEPLQASPYDHPLVVAP